jgi:hypothetical protein
MEMGSRPQVRPRITGRIVLAGLIAGTVSGACALFVEMLYGLFSSSRSFWDAPMAMFSWVFGIQHYTRNSPGDHFWPVILGIVGFVALMAILGVAFAALMTVMRASNDGTILAAALLSALVGWVVLRYIIVPLNSGEEKLITTSAVSPQWFWWLSLFAISGLALGASYDAERRFEPEWWAEAQRQESRMTPTT